MPVFYRLPVSAVFSFLQPAGHPSPCGGNVAMPQPFARRAAAPHPHFITAGPDWTRLDTVAEHLIANRPQLLWPVISGDHVVAAAAAAAARKRSMSCEATESATRTAIAEWRRSRPDTDTRRTRDTTTSPPTLYTLHVTTNMFHDIFISGK